MLEMKTWQEKYEITLGAEGNVLCAGEGIIHSMARTLGCLYRAGKENILSREIELY
jgi:hypothetical protein